ncbi:uncharacterized protein BO95DRAFT_133042 [Aspergillus brunneoviolaceus CBS 621.78]|uniref:Uncharacterized protein n=1 Tax=Aspergillus brunneoviolaceus CBS 621.78 TaxID=1450534 RepID=A0ACD1G923_9EURO|nr:hypothetical protein BO95DRAFT_133042 [Aspergillus brunneoviolaceus CBS 621.78]RAH45743.1 hypothetical protein BO95DRAFT_133042 [Aspergillus brunneoviolaceus CBS 621.78]
MITCPCLPRLLFILPCQTETPSHFSSVRACQEVQSWSSKFLSPWCVSFDRKNISSQKRNRTAKGTISKNSKKC